MSFLWKSVDTSANLCKLCPEKDKRILDYDSFFNETKDVLKSKEEKLVEAQIKLSEKISEIELLKKLYESEKRIWQEDKKVWQESRKQFTKDAMEWEIEKAKYEETLEDLNNEKIISSRKQKMLEDKISSLVHALKDNDEKYQDLMQRVTEQNVLQSDEIREREEDIIAIYDRRIEELIEDFYEKENEWKCDRSDFEMTIQRLEESNLELSMKIQELKYDLEFATDKHDEMLKIQEEKWEKRVSTLNETYDSDFIQYKQHFKQKEETLEKEKQELVATLQSEIESLKKENIHLEDAKKKIEKKIVEIYQENESLTHERNEEQKRYELLKNEKNELVHELETNKKILEISKTQTAPALHPTVKLDSESDLLDSESKKNAKKKKPANSMGQIQVQNGIKKRTPAPAKSGYDPYGHPFVEEMNKYEKKTDFQKADLCESWIVDIHDDFDPTKEDPSNFFLQNLESSPTVLCNKVKDLEHQLRLYQEELDVLKTQNTEYVKKIKSLECNSILQFNRNLRSRIPVPFFAYHSNFPVQFNTNSSSQNYTSSNFHHTID
jgi:hypothetical protein